MDEQVYKRVWADLPAASVLTPAAAKWARPWIWRNAKTEYHRTAPLALSVTVQQHSMLTWLLGQCAVVSAGAVSFVEAAWNVNAFPKKEGEVSARSWPRGFGAAFMESVTVESRGMNIPEGSTAWHARERAAAHALSFCKTKVETGVHPRLPYHEGLPVGLSVRVATGLHYPGSPFQRAEGKWMLLRDIGWVGVEPETLARLEQDEQLDRCHYVEVAQYEQTWWARLIFAREREASEKAPKRTSEPGKKATGKEQAAAAPAPAVEPPRPKRKPPVWLEGENRNRAKMGMPPMTDDEIESACAGPSRIGDRR